MREAHTLTEYRHPLACLPPEQPRLTSTGNIPCAGYPTAFSDLLLCYRSGQISERQWQEHLKDERLRQWLGEQDFGHLT